MVNMVGGENSSGERLDYPVETFEAISPDGHELIVNNRFVPLANFIALPADSNLLTPIRENLPQTEFSEPVLTSITNPHFENFAADMVDSLSGDYYRALAILSRYDEHELPENRRRDIVLMGLEREGLRGNLISVAGTLSSLPVVGKYFDPLTYILSSTEYKQRNLEVRSMAEAEVAQRVSDMVSGDNKVLVQTISVPAEGLQFDRFVIRKTNKIEPPPQNSSAVFFADAHIRLHKLLAKPYRTDISTFILGDLSLPENAEWQYLSSAYFRHGKYSSLRNVLTIFADGLDSIDIGDRIIESGATYGDDLGNVYTGIPRQYQRIHRGMPNPVKLTKHELAHAYDDNISHATTPQAEGWAAAIEYDFDVNALKHHIKKYYGPLSLRRLGIVFEENLHANLNNFHKYDIPAAFYAFAYQRYAVALGENANQALCNFYDLVAGTKTNNKGESIRGNVIYCLEEVKANYGGTEQQEQLAAVNIVTEFLNFMNG